MFAFLMAAPLLAQRHFDLLLDAEGAHRTGTNTDFTPGVRYDPQFSNGGGIGGGINWYFTDRVSLEAKVAALQTHMRVRSIGSDFVATADLGHAQIYPITAVLQWHMLEHGAIRPYLGAGVGHIIVRNINKQIGPTGAGGIKFQDPTGLVVDGGLEARLSKRLGLTADARYIPVETSSRATFIGTTSSVVVHERPLIVSFGIAYHF